jgi:spoIIIJ-associated protein
MRSVEVEGESIDDAIRKALIELGVTRDRAAIEILNDASRGILGFGGQKARVRARVRAPLATSLADLDEREPPRVSRETAIRPSIDPGRRPTPVTTAPASPAPVSRETDLDGRGLAPNVRRAGIAPAPARVAPTSAMGVADDVVAKSRRVLEELLSHIGVTCEVSQGPSADGTTVNLAIEGESSALLIGKHGQTLDAIEYLLNRIVVREAGSTMRIEVDVEGYRARREQSLTSIARRMADKVRQTGRPATVDLMNPRDRRIIHIALKDEAGVTSRSQGEGFLRKLVILPAGKRRNGPRSARDAE